MEEDARTTRVTTMYQAGALMQPLKPCGNFLRSNLHESVIDLKDQIRRPPVSEDIIHR
jgi:hypothetical protein